jgi:hypothetical protein
VVVLAPLLVGPAGWAARSPTLGQGSHAVILIHAPSHAGAAVAGDPDNLALDASVQVATTAVIGEEGVQVGQQGHCRKA